LVTQFTLRGVEAAIFDLDSTLINTHRYPIHVAHWLLSRVIEDYTEYEERYLQRLIHHYFVLIKSIADGAPYMPPLQVVRTAMHRGLLDIGLDTDDAILDEAAMFFKTTHVKIATLYEGVEDLLTRMQDAGMRLGVITNSFEGNAALILQKLDLSTFFQVIVDGGVVQCYKPASAIFEYALKKLKTTPTTTTFVGDEYYADIVGAARLGMNTVWLNHRHQDINAMKERYHVSEQPTLSIHNIAELALFL
jgi:HAD superfamily hydrolase (TIGR01662 family)